MSAWQQYSSMLKSSFSARNASLDRNLIISAAQLTSPEVARRACVKWASAWVENMKPHLEKTWSSYDIVRKIDLVRLTLEPIRNSCREVDNALNLSSKAERDFLVKAESLLLTESIIEELRNWAKTDLTLNESELDRSSRAVLSDNLRRLGWLGRLEPCFTDSCYEAVRRHLKRFCSMKFDEPMLALMIGWSRRVPGPWLVSMLESPAAAAEALQRLDFFIHQAFGDMRSREFFDIVAAFPDSAATVDDLKMCLERTHARAELVVRVNDSLKRRLLHGGANTNSILLVFIRLIKTMRRLDPSGMLLESIAEPVKSYLRTRPETVRCIVTALTNDNHATGANAELYEELGLENETNIRPIDFDMDEENDGAEPADVDNKNDDDIVEEETQLGANVAVIGLSKRSAFDDIAVDDMRAFAIPMTDWTPDPIEANLKPTSKARTSNDIFGNLIRVYGSKELFIHEYRLLLAERLLNRTTDFDVDSELHRLELLKLRFGENTMLACDVMLKDVSDSRRANQHIQRPNKLEAMIVSRHFWPQFSPNGSVGDHHNGNPAAAIHSDPPFRVHPKIKNSLDQFGANYSKFKKPRKLVWANQLGVVDLELTFADQSTKEFTNLTTLQANMAMHFAERREWPLTDLSRVLNLDPEVVRRKIAFWIAEGVVSENKDSKIYYVAESAPSGQDPDAEGGEDEMMMEEEEDQVDVNEHEEMEAAMAEARDKTQLDFITTMLTNLDGASLENIHRSLQLFSAALVHGYDRTEEELEAFLESCIEKGHLEFVDNKYVVANQ